MKVKKATTPATNDVNKQEKIRLLIDQCNKSLGTEGKIYVGTQHTKLERIPTGVLAFDTITGGGLVRGQLLELYGEESSGKTLLSLLSAAAVQKVGGVVVWVKGESFDAAWAERLGVDLSSLVLVEAATGDTALEAAMTMVESGYVDLLVMDSYQALGTRRESEAGVEAESYGGGGASQMWGRVMRRAYAAANGGPAARTCFLGISQVRAKIGGFSPNGQPDPEPTGIKALRHWKGISVQCKKGEPTYNDGSKEKRFIVAREFRLRCVKNKTFPPERTGAFTFYFRNWQGVPFGVDKALEACRLGRYTEVLTSKGSWIEGCGLRAQGEEGFVAQLRANPKALQTLVKAIMEAVVRE